MELTLTRISTGFYDFYQTNFHFYWRWKLVWEFSILIFLIVFESSISESIDSIAKETEEHFKQTANLVNKNDEKIREIFIEHSREVDKFKHNLE